MKITILAGTNRPDSNTRRVVKTLEALYAEVGTPADVLDLADLPPEIFSPTSYAEKPPAFVENFSNRILASDGLVVVSPEYNGSMPGVLKYFIDMLPFPESFERRPVCFVGLAAGNWGALRALEQLQHIFGYRNAFIYPERTFMPGINGVIDDSGITDAELLKRLRGQAAGFVEFVGKLRPDR